jgi:hypothetical protein
MPSFDFVKTVVSAFVLVFLLANIVMHFMKMFKEGFEGEATTPAAATATTVATTPSVGTEIDYASKISTDMSDLFETVNKQMEITKTIKIPISTETIKVSYNRDLTPKMKIYGNLLTLMNDGIMKVEEDLKNVKTYEYIGNTSVKKMSDELAKVTEATVSTNCSIEAFEDATDTPLKTITPAADACLRKNEYDTIQRVKVIVNSHQKTIDKILEKRASQ